jgi:citrate synthase
MRRLVVALSPDRTRERAALGALSVAEASLHVLGARPTARAIATVDATLVVCADHELNASTFAARVAASTGSDLYACITAALATLSGPLHGGASDRVEALLDEVKTPDRAGRVLSERARRGDAVPGFGHPLYPSGDPRGTLLLEGARRLESKSARLDTLLAVVRAMRRAGAPEPNLDVGLVAVRAALGLAPGSAAALFAIGRCAGFVAHVLEQRSSGKLLRPRARYVGRARRPMSSSRSSP